MSTVKSILISDFTINNLGGFLSNSEGEPAIASVIAPFNQVQQVLLDGKMDCWSANPDFAVVWCQPERVIYSFNSLLNNENVKIEILLKEVDQFSELLKNLSGRVKFTLVASFTIDPKRFTGLTAYKEAGIIQVLQQLNLRLSKNLSETNSFYLLDAQQWINTAGTNAYQDKLWYLSKIPFHNSVFEKAAREIKSAVRGILGLSKKLIIVDLDDTIWGGIVGDAGMENLVLGGHDPLGEAYADVQRELKSLVNKGILLGIVSKNEESTALDAIEKHLEMFIRKKDLAGWKINWNDKAQNISDLVKQLNLGLDFVIFIDDNPVERARVREALPAVFVPEMPSDKLLYPSFIRSLDCFNTTAASREDAERTKLYKEEEFRSQSLNTFQSLEEWLKTIDIKIKAEPVSKKNIQRVAQLLNKTNQMNLRTRRMSEQGIMDWLENKTNLMWAFSVSDKFGDAGLTGITGVSILDGNAQLTDFILSCRVMGRKTEEMMLGFAIQQAAKNKYKKLVAEYLPTEKNKPCLGFFENSGMNRTNTKFEWDCAKHYTVPPYINFTHEI